MKILIVRSIIFLACSSLGVQASTLTVFSTNFDVPLPTGIDPGTALLTDVQGYAELGPAGNQFGGNFLRSETANIITITLNGLPEHTAIDIKFLFAAIDSLDGTGIFPAGDFFHIKIDSITFFRESFANAIDTQIQSYISPAGVELARRVDLGFGGPGSYYTDSAYDMSADPIFSHIPHTNSSVNIEFIIDGAGIQSLGDESWAMDNLFINVHQTCPCDFNADAIVNLADFAFFSARFGLQDCSAENNWCDQTDKNMNTNVDLTDLLDFATVFLTTTCP